MTFETRNLTPRVGVEIKSDPATLLGGEYAKTIRELLEVRGAIVFPRIDLTDEQQLAFSRTLGGVIEQGEKGIFKVTLDPKENQVAAYLRGTVLWHFDGFNDDVPTLASLLSCRRKSDVGGQTSFANTYAAWDDLPDPRKRELVNLRVAHSMAASQRYVTDPTPQEKSGWASYPSKTHPLVWTHRSGRKSLLLGSSTDHIVGMDRVASDALLDELNEWATQPQFVYRHEWTIGDLVIWDNTGVLHKVDAYPANSGRMMHRTTLVGEEAIQ